MEASLPDFDEELRRRQGLTFAQAEGIAELPRQLRRDEVSAELRARLWRFVHTRLIEAEARYDNMIMGAWAAAAESVHVEHLHRFADDFSPRTRFVVGLFRPFFEDGDWAELYGLLQFLCRDRNVGSQARSGFGQILEDSRSPYRVIEETLVPIASDAEKRTIARAFNDLRSRELGGARQHLRSAAEHLTVGRWADSARDSVHAVEAVARTLEPSAELSRALARLEQTAKIHGALKKGFGAIYGYTSDEQGIRHPLVDDDAAAVDEADALFMIGACAAFVTYLIGKARAAGLLES